MAGIIGGRSRGAARLYFLYLGFIFLVGMAGSSSAADPKALALVRQALAAQGGEDKLRAIQSAQLSAQGYRNMVEQSERPEGPYIPEFRSLEEIHDFEGGRYRSVAEQLLYPEFKYSAGILADDESALRIAGGSLSAGTPDMLQAAHDSLALAPERLLLTALGASDLRLGKGMVLQSVPQDVVDFSLGGSPVTIILNRFTHLPTAVDYSGPAARDGYWRFVGDVTMRTYYSYWWLGDGGVRLPMQWDVYRNGLHDGSLMITKFQVNAPLDEAALRISPEMHAKFRQAAVSWPAVPVLPKPIEAAPGVTLFPGSWNVALVRQRDGIVVLEAPISSAYSEQVLAEAARLYPGTPVKAVVTTSDSWPHIAGIRTYAARGIPIYCLDLNMPILRRLIKSHFSARPDALEKRPREPLFRSLSGKVTIGDGPTQIDLYPIRGETSERQVMAYLPNLRLLYGSDPFQQGPSGGYRTTQAVTELMGAAARERINPNRFFMMHVGVTSWGDLAKALSEARPQFPDGRLQ